MVCKGRQDAFGGAPHTELAVTYDDDGLFFLGKSTQRAFTPHTEFASYDVPFQVPTYWTAQSGEDVNNLLRGFSRVISGEITKDQLFQTYPPKYHNVLWALLDFEGIVLFWYVDGKWMYAKAKTIAYYIAHKPKHHYGLETLLALAVTGRFENVNNLLRPAGVEFTKEYLQAGLTAVANHLDDALRPDAPDLSEPFAVAINKLKGKKVPLTQLQRIVIGDALRGGGDKKVINMLQQSFEQSFPLLDVKKNGLDKVLQQITMTVLLDANPETRLKKIASITLDDADTTPGSVLAKKLRELCTAQTI